MESGRRPFSEDWATRFQLIREGRIRPVNAERFSIVEAAQADAPPPISPPSARRGAPYP